MIHLSEPLLDGNELEYISRCVKSGWISSKGRFVTDFERQFSDHLDCHSIAVSSGTAALHLALKSLGIGPGDDVIIPNLTFAAVANAVIHCGALPVLCDVDRTTWNINPELIESLITYRTKAIIAVHSWGHPADMVRINAIANKRNIKVIEDCAEAQGALYEGHMVGKLSDVGCFSFFSNKIMTTGEGGMVTTRDSRIADKVRLLRDHGTRGDYWHEVAGFNYRMTNLQAAVGVAQMERIDKLIQHRIDVGEHYLSRLIHSKLVMPPCCVWAKTVFWLFSVLVESRDEFISALKRKGIETRPFFHPLHKQPPYRLDAVFPVSEELSARGISLPSGNSITKDEVDHVCDAILELV